MIPPGLLVAILASAVSAAEVATAPPTVANVPRIQTMAWESIASVESIARRFGDPLLRAATHEELEKLVSQLGAEPAFLGEIATLLPELERFRSMISQLSSLPILLDQVLERFPPEARALVQHTLAVSLEIAARLPVFDFAIPSGEALQEEMRTAMEADPDFRRFLEGSACGLAVGRLADADAPDADPMIVRTLSVRALEANRLLLTKIDPLQAVLDRAAEDFPEPFRSGVVRLAYAWDVDATGAPCILIWIVLRDDVLARGALVSANLQLMLPIARGLAAVDRREPFFLRARASSESTWPLAASFSIKLDGWRHANRKGRNRRASAARSRLRTTHYFISLARKPPRWSRPGD